MKLTLLLSALAVSGNAVSENGPSRSSNHIRSNIQVQQVLRDADADVHDQPKSMVDAAEEFIDFEFELLRRRLQAANQEVNRCSTWCRLPPCRAPRSMTPSSTATPQESLPSCLKLKKRIACLLLN